MLGVKVDGAIHSITLGALSQADSKEVISNYLNLRDQIYKRLAKSNDQDRFLRGWLNRTDHLREIVGLKSPPIPLLAVIGKAMERGLLADGDQSRSFVAFLEKFQHESGLFPTGTLDNSTLDLLLSD